MKCPTGRGIPKATVRRWLVITWFSLLGFGVAQDAIPQEVQAFLEPLQSYAGVAAAGGAVRAAELRLRQAYDPVELDARTAYGYTPEEEDVSGLSADLDVSFHPFVFGDRADLVRQRELELEAARLDYLAALTQLEAQALEAASRLQLGNETLTVARQRVEVAELSLRSNRMQVERGTGSAEAVRSAEQELSAAQVSVADAEVAQMLAESELNTLVGEARLGEVPTLPLPQGTALQVKLARLEVGLARLGVRRAERELYPELDASYTQSLGGGNAVTAAIGSRNLAPSVGYDYRYQRDSDALDTRLEVSLSVSLSPGAFNALAAAKEDVEAATARLSVAMTEAELESERLENAIAQSQERLELARTTFENVQESLVELQGREALGLTTPLDTQRATLALNQAALELQTERLILRSALLDLYRYYALPLSTGTVDLGEP